MQVLQVLGQGLQNKGHWLEETCIWLTRSCHTTHSDLGRMWLWLKSWVDPEAVNSWRLSVNRTPYNWMTNGFLKGDPSSTSPRLATETLHILLFSSHLLITPSQCSLLFPPFPQPLKVRMYQVLTLDSLLIWTLFLNLNGFQYHLCSAHSFSALVLPSPLNFRLLNPVAYWVTPLLMPNSSLTLSDQNRTLFYFPLF